MFSQSYIQFFQDLSVNNNTEWFNANKKTYENDVKKPFETFIAKIIDEVHQISPEILIDPKDAIFRINKDIRFSADNSPYKTEMSAVISRLGKKGNPCPGLYINLGAEKTTIASGLKMLEKQQLADIRYHIANNLEQFEAIIHNPNFKAAFGEIQGEKIKRLPEEFKEAAEKQSLLFNTSFIAMAELPATEIIKTNFEEQVINLYKLSMPFVEFFKKTLEL
jgi:uncharacterized protein (TIGR02453 family)